MKKILYLFLLILVSELAQAQYYYIPFTNAGQNPGNLNNDAEFPSGGGLPTGWATIAGPTNANPAWSSTQTIPFTFLFNANPVTQFKVSTSGVLTFDVATAVAAPSYTKAALPSAAIPDNSVCIWGLAGKGTNDNIVTKTFGTSPNRQLWIHFNSFGYGATASDGSNYTYWSIVLEETTNNIYLVDARTGGYATTKKVSAGVQINATTAYSVTGSPNLTALAGTNATAADNTYYQFIQGVQPNFDLGISKINTPPYLALGNNDIVGVIKNYGASTITSVKVNYTINGGAVVSDSLTGLSIAPLATYTFTHSTPWTSTAPGAYTVDCYASDINGANSDQNNLNDSASKVLNILLYLEQRKPLFEIFTGSTCPPCQPGNANFHGIVDTINQDDFVSIKYQQNFPGTGDPYTTIESTNRRSAYYGINSIPRMENDGGWDGNANSFTYALYQDARNVPAAFSMSGTYTSDTVTRTYSAKVKYSPLFNATSTKLQVAIVEKTTSLNVKTNGETAFFHVMKKMLPDDFGTPIPAMLAGSMDSITITYTFNGNYRLPTDGQAANIIDNTIEHSVEEFSDLTILGWLQADDGTKQVFQAANFIEETITGVYPMNKSVNSILIYPNPAKDFTTVDISLTDVENIKVQLMDAEGRKIEVQQLKGQVGLNKIQFNVSNLAAGFYHVAVSDSKNNAFVKRIAVIK
jgi:Secretion system C-terminal sorting domain